MERFTQQSAQERITILQKKLSTALEVLDHVAQPGRIESRQAATKPHSERSAQNLTLAGLTDEERWARLAKTIIPLQETLLGEAIPNFEERINKTLQAAEIARIRSLREQYDTAPLYPPLRDYREVINSPQMVAFLEKGSKPLRDLFRAFISGKGASRVLNPLVRFAGTATINTNHFDSYLAGAIFEEVGYLHTAGLSRAGDITVLSPEETATLFRNIHRRRFDTGYSYGFNFMLEGISVPDGLVISNKEDCLDIVLIAEYKNIGRNNSDISYVKMQRQYYTPEQLEADLRLTNHQPLDPVEVGRLIHAIRPSLLEKPVRVSAQLQPLYIVPRGADLNVQGILIEEVPATTAAIHAFGQELKRIELLRR